MYQQHGKEPPAKFRPKVEAFRSCTTAQRHPAAFTETVINDICTRWQATRMLRELYLDPAITVEFRAFRTSLRSASNTWSTFEIVSPGFEPGLGYRCERGQSQYGAQFNSLFHKAICLHSLSIAMRTVAGVTHRSWQWKKAEILFAANNAWTKKNFTIGGHAYKPSLETKAQCLEIWDFIYNFLCRKLFPPDAMSEWINACMPSLAESISHVPVYKELVDAMPTEPFWGYFINHLRLVLHPQDIVGAIASKTWSTDSTFTTDKHEFMVLRGSFDIGALPLIVSISWSSWFDRFQMVQHLGAGEEPRFRGEESPLWWDDCREELGSPFHPDFDWGALISWVDDHDDYPTSYFSNCLSTDSDSD